MKMSKSIKVGIIASLITAVVVGYVTNVVFGNLMSFHGDVNVYAVLYRVAPICGHIAQVVTAISLPIIGTQVVQAIKKGK